MWFNYAREWGAPDRMWESTLRHQLSPGGQFDRYSEEAEIYYKGGTGYLQDGRPRKPAPGSAEWLPEAVSSDSPSTLDGIAAGEAGGFVTGLISDKTKFAGIAVNSLQGLINERLQIRERNIEQIDSDICHAITLLYELLPWAQLGGFERQRQTLDMALFGLGREKRMEDVSCWRDVSRVQQEFVTALADYAAAAKREGLFRDGSYLDR